MGSSCSQGHQVQLRAALRDIARLLLYLTQSPRAYMIVQFKLNFALSATTSKAPDVLRARAFLCLQYWRSLAALRRALFNRAVCPSGRLAC